MRQRREVLARFPTAGDGNLYLCGRSPAIKKRVGVQRQTDMRRHRAGEGGTSQNRVSDKPIPIAGSPDSVVPDDLLTCTTEKTVSTPRRIESPRRLPRCPRTKPRKQRYFPLRLASMRRRRTTRLAAQRLSTRSMCSLLRGIPSAVAVDAPSSHHAQAQPKPPWIRSSASLLSLQWVSLR